MTPKNRREYYETALSQAIAAGDYGLASAVQRTLADRLRTEERWDEALAAYEQAIAYGERAGDKGSLVRALQRIGDIHRTRRHYGPAAEVLARLLPLQSALGDRDGAERTRRLLWQYYVLLGQYDNATATATEPIGLSTPTDGSIVRGEVQIEGLVQHPQFVRWQVDLLIDGDENKATYLGHRWSQRWGGLLTFDSTRYPNGTHRLRLRIVREGSNYDEYYSTITIDN